MESASESHLLTETKRLLTALNDENRELKAENTRLISQCAAATGRAMRVSQEKESLEKDLKQINFNLMQQLRAKLGTLKEKEQQVLQLQEQAITLESQLQELHLTLNSATKESDMRQEEAAALEGRLQHQTERLFRAEAVAGKFADDLNNTMSGHHETTAKLRRESLERVNQLEDELRASRSREVSLERVVDEVRYELSQTKDALRQNYRDTRSNSNSNTINHNMEPNNSNRNNIEGRRRELSAMSDALYAHEQVLTSCSSSYQQLREMQHKLRGAKSLLSEATMYMEHAFPAREAQLREEVDRFIRTDETLMTLFSQRITEKEQELRTTQGKLANTQQYLQEVENVHKDRLEAERREHKEACAELQGQVSGLQQRLLMSDQVEQKLRTELKSYQRSLDAERQRSEAVRRSYERDVERLDGELQEFTTAVSRALHKLEPSVLTSSQHRRSSGDGPLSFFSLNSVTAKPSSTAEAVVSIETDAVDGGGGFMTLSDSTGLVRDGCVSPSVVSIEPSPSAP